MICSISHMTSEKRVALGIQKFDTEKLREIIKVIRVHGQNEIEIKWNFDDIFSEQR